MTDNWKVEQGDCRDIMRTLPDNSVDAIVSDPPYGLSFMGKEWDHGVPGVEFWTEALRVAKPGAHLVAFGGTRTYHRLAVAIEDAGWEVRDCLSWLYGSGFPKSLAVDKAIDKRGGYPHLAAQIGEALRMARESRGLTVGECDKRFCGGTTNWSWFEGRPKGQRAPTTQTFAAIAAEWPEVAHLAEAVAEAEREVVGRDTKARSTAGASALPTMGGSVEYKSWDITAPATDAAKRWHGWGTALKPAWEPIILARKPLTGTVAANVTQYGTGAINVDGCRIGTDAVQINRWDDGAKPFGGGAGHAYTPSQSTGRWPANVLLDEDAAGMLDAQTGTQKSGVAGKRTRQNGVGNWGYGAADDAWGGYGDSGGASRFFFVAREGQCENVNIAGQDLSQPNQREDFAPAPASLAHSRERCQRGRDCTADCTDCTRHLNLAPSAGAMDNTGTIQTIPTCCESCGSALPVTDASINQASAEKVADASDPVSGTRFLYTSKVSRREREAGLDGMPKEVRHFFQTGNGESGKPSSLEIDKTKNPQPHANGHPTVKPIALMRWLCRLVTPPNGLILDPFNGSGSTGCAAVLEGFRYLGCELEAEYVEIARRRIAYWQTQRAEPDLFG